MTSTQSLQSSETPPEVELEDYACPLGCERADELVLSGVQDRLHKLPGRYSVVRCRHCGLMRTNPRPTPATIGFYYPSDYAPYQVEPETIAQTSTRATLAKRIVRRFFDERHTCIPDMPVGRALEIGCASGKFLRELRRGGWEADGVEFNAGAAAHAQAAGFRVHVGQLEQAPAPGATYDLVVAWMVLEHMHEPVAVLRKLRDWTRPGALLALSVPDCGAWELSAFGKYWFSLHIPQHLYHFDRRTLSKVMQSGGWTIKDIKNHRELWPVRASSNYLINDNKALGPLTPSALERMNAMLLHGWIWRPLAAMLAALRQTGGMTIVARRND